MLWFRDSEWAIWLTPFAVKPQCDNERRLRPFEIFAIGPARWTAPKTNLKINRCLWSEIMKLKMKNETGLCLNNRYDKNRCVNKSLIKRSAEITWRIKNKIFMNIVIASRKLPDAFVHPREESIYIAGYFFLLQPIVRWECERLLIHKKKLIEQIVFASLARLMAMLITSTRSQALCDRSFLSNVPRAF